MINRHREQQHWKRDGVKPACPVDRRSFKSKKDIKY